MTSQNSSKACFDVSDLIKAIEHRQEVLNKSELTEAMLKKHINTVASLEDADADAVGFLANPRFAPMLVQTKAGVVIVDAKRANDIPLGSIGLVVSSPYLAYASISQLFFKTSERGIHPTAIIAEDAILEEDVAVGAYAVIGSRVRIGRGSRIEAHCIIEDDVKIGMSCTISPHVFIGRECVLGDDVRVHAHANIGSEGFGFAPIGNPAKQGWERIAQLGRVVIGSRVRIGSQTCIDRGAINDTMIEDDVIIDNLVQIAHNVHIGRGTAIAANSGIAGSTTIGSGCIIGGASGINGHINIGDGVTLTGMSMVTKSIESPGIYSSGTGLLPSKEWRKAVVRFRHLGEGDDN